MSEIIDVISIVTDGMSGITTVTVLYPKGSIALNDQYTASAGPPFNQLMFIQFNAVSTLKGATGILEACFGSESEGGLFHFRNKDGEPLSLSNGCWRIDSTNTTTPATQVRCIEDPAATGPIPLNPNNADQKMVHCFITKAGTTAGAGFLSDAATPCCIHPTAKIETPFGLTQIKDIKAGDKVKDIHGRFINVHYNIKFMPTQDFICIKKDAFGPNKPFEDLKATGGHPLFNNGKEVTFENLVNGNTIVEQKLDDEFVYSLCTEERTYVMTNGVPVCTWAQQGWENCEESKTQRWWKL